MAKKLLKGVFYDSPVIGLEYETLTTSGLTNEKAEFEYRKGEEITFSVGGLVLGSTTAKSMITPADLVIEIGGNIRKLKNFIVTNMSRFLQSLDKGGDIEERIVITDSSASAHSRFRTGKQTLRKIRNSGLSTLIARKIISH